MNKVTLSSFNNDWYKPESAIKRLLWYICSIIFFKNGLFAFYGFKVFLLRLFGAKIGQSVLIKPSVNIKYPWLLSVGNNVWIGEDVWIDNLANVRIANDVCISQGALLLCGNHNFSMATFDLIVQPIIIEDGVWIGAKAIVTGGVICATHTVLAVGSCLSASTEAYGIYRGNPAVKVKERVVR